MSYKKVSMLLATASLFFGGSVAKAVTAYSQLSTVGLVSNTASAPDALDDVNFAAGTVASGANRLSAVTAGYVVAPGTAAQNVVVFFDFYNLVDSASTGAVESQYIGGFGGILAVGANTGTGGVARSFGFIGLDTLATPVNFTDDNIGVEISFYNAGVTAYSTVLTPLSSTPGVPTIGSSVTGLYRDPGGNDFQATDFNATLGNLYLSLSTVAVPEPTSAALLGVAGVALVRRRRR